MNQFLKLLLAATMIFCPNLALAQSAMKGGGLIEGVTSVVSSASTVTISAVWRPTYYVTTGTSSQLYVLPAATALPVGRYYIFKNESTGMVTIQANGGTVLRVLAPNERSEIRLTANGTAAGTWSVENNAAVNVAQATYFGGITQNGATSCNYGETTSSGPTNFITLAGASGCNAWTVKPGGTGTVAGIAANTQGIILTNVPAGTLTVSLKAGISNNNNSAICNFRIYDGTSGYDPQFLYVGATSGVSIPTLQFTVPVTTPQSSLTLQVQASGGAGGNCAIDNAVAGRGAAFDVTYFPSQAQAVVRMNNSADLMGTVFYSGKAICPANSLPADGAAVSRTTYSDLFNNIGTTFGTGNGSTTFNVPNLAGVFVRGTGTQIIGGISYSGVLGTAQTDQFQDHTHAPAGSNYMYYNGSGGATGYTATAAAQVGLTTASGAANSGRAGTETRPANIGMTPCIWYVSNPAPLISGGVTSSSAGMERVERASVFCDATSSITSQSGSWLSSIGNITSNRCTLTIAAGLFSSKPTCTATVNSTSTTLLISPSINPTSATNVTIGCMFLSGGAAAPCGGSNQYDVICVGPR